MKKVDYYQVYSEISGQDQALFRDLQRQIRLEDSMEFLKGFLKDDEVITVKGEIY